MQGEHKAMPMTRHRLDKHWPRLRRMYWRRSGQIRERPGSLHQPATTSVVV